MAEQDAWVDVHGIPRARGDEFVAEGLAGVVAGDDGEVLLIVVEVGVDGLGDGHDDGLQGLGRDAVWMGAEDGGVALDARGLEGNGAR